MKANIYLISYLVFCLSMFIFACTRAYYETWIEKILPRKRDYKEGELLIATKCGPRGDRSYISNPIRILGVYDYHITYQILWDEFTLRHCGPDKKDRRMLLTEAELYEFVTPKLFPTEDNKHIGSSVDEFYGEEGIELIRLCCKQEPELKETWEYDEGRGYFMKCAVCGTHTAPYPEVKLAKEAWDSKVLL